MKRMLTALIAAATVASAALATSAPAEARWGWGWGWGLGGFAAGAVIGSARITGRHRVCGAMYGTATPGFAPASEPCDSAKCEAFPSRNRLYLRMAEIFGT
jgi:hypothetical protein